MDGLEGGMEEDAAGMDGARAEEAEAGGGEEEVVGAEKRLGSGIAPLGRNDVRTAAATGVSKGEADGVEVEAAGVAVGAGRGEPIEAAGLER
jgi:hypothetical protein